MSFIPKVDSYLKAAYPLLSILTHEEVRIEKELKLAFQDRKVITWDSQNGLVNSVREPVGKDTDDADKLLLFIRNYNDKQTIFLLRDFHLQFELRSKRVDYIRAIRNMLSILSANQNTVIFIGPAFPVPLELEKDIQSVEYALPTEEAIAASFDAITNAVNRKLVDSAKPALKVSAAVRTASIEAAKGMTHSELASAFSLAWITNKAYNDGYVASVFEEKIMRLKQTGLLEYIPTSKGFNDVGGLDELKTWIGLRMKGFSAEAKKFGLKTPKGILLAGLPGTGKSAVVKAVAHEFNLPLFELNIASLFGGLVGQTENNMIRVCKLIDSIGACVLRLEEIEKAFSNNAVSGAGDSGTSSRAFGTFLTWLNDRTTPAFIIATSNDHTILPDALKRKGRWDELYWIDLPNESDLKQIFKVILQRVGRNSDKYNLPLFAREAKDFTGAEVEYAIDEAMYIAFNSNEEVTDEHILKAISTITPQAKMFGDRLETMRKEAIKTLKLASKVQDDTLASQFRNIDI